MDNAKNFAKVTVSTGYSAAATSIVLTTGHGARLPTAPFNCVWWNSSDYPDPGDDPNVEFVRVTAVVSNTLTVVRGQEDTDASAKNTANKTYKMIAGLTAKVINTDIPALLSGILSVVGNQVIGADSDANGTGTLTLQTRALDRLTVLNNGDIQVANQLGINVAPDSALHIKATYPIDTTASEYPIRLTPPSGEGDFVFMLNTTMFDVQRDDVVWWGWNADNSTPGEPNIHFAMEREFGTDYEVHLESDPISHAIIRHWTWNIHRTTGQTIHTVRADTINLQSATVGTNYIQLKNIPATTPEILTEGPWRFVSDSINFQTTTNGGATAKQINILPHPADAGRSCLVFGSPVSGGGITFAQDATYGFIIKLRSAGSDIENNAWLYAKRLYASFFYDEVNDVQVVGPRGAAVADATDGPSAITQLNALLARLRTHGLIAT